jgi:hypothetical protein
MNTVEKAIKALKNASTLEEYDESTKKISVLFSEISKSKDKELIKSAIREKAQAMHESAKALSQKTDELLAQFYAQSPVTIAVDNKKYSTSEWATIEDYCKEYQLKSTTVVTNWIKRKKIPSENIVTFPSLGGLKLIKKVAY